MVPLVRERARLANHHTPPTRTWPVLHSARHLPAQHPQLPHRPTRGWDDVGYSFFACPHGYDRGRGLNRVQAAQPGGNATHYSCTLAGGPSDTITEDQINAVRELRLWLKDDHGNNGRVLGHRDFISTSCPGDRAYALVKDGTFTKAPGIISTGDDVSFLGLRKGDKGQRVRDFQKYLDDAGAGSTFANGEWDRIFGDGGERAVFPPDTARTPRRPRTCPTGR